MKRLTDLDKLDCAEYVLDILTKTPIFSRNGLDISVVEWVLEAKDECITRRGQYLVVDEPIAPKGEEDE